VIRMQIDTLTAIVLFACVTSLVLSVAALLVASDARKTADLSWRRRHLGEHQYQEPRIFR